MSKGHFNLIIQESRCYTNATQLPNLHLHFHQIIERAEGSQNWKCGGGWRLKISPRLLT